MTIDEALCNIKQGYGIPHKHETLTTIIEYLKQTEPCEDAISRQWIKTAIHNFYDGLMHTPTEEDIQAYLSVAPSVQPKAKTGWIPVSERLPECGQRVLTSGMIRPFDERCKIRIAIFYDGHFWPISDDMQILSGVRAWMPLPEPYKAESEE